MGKERDFFRALHDPAGLGPVLARAASCRGSGLSSALDQLADLCQGLEPF